MTTKKASKSAGTTSRWTKANKNQTTKAASAKSSTKKDIVLELLRRKQGATITDIAKSTDWQNHTVRGFLSGTVTKKMGIPVESSKSDAGERTYRIVN